MYSKLNNKHSNFNKELSNGNLNHSKGSDEHSEVILRSKQKKKALVRIATIKSRVKGHHVNSYNYKIGEELECKFEAPNKYINHGIDEGKNKNSKRKTSKRSYKEWITVGHIPNALAEILFPLMKTWKIYSMKDF